MNCVVFGGGGFIGSHLTETLLACGHKVGVFDRAEARFLDNLERAGANLYIGDFLDQELVTKAISNCDLVYHLASATVPKTSNDNPIHDVEVNIIGTLRLLEAARNRSVRKIVFSSSGGTVYGIPHEIPIKESHPTEPTSSYGISKLTNEKYLHLYSSLYGLNYSILRIANAYGERQPVTGSQGVIGAFLHNALHDHEIQVWGDGSVIRDYTYVSDIVDAFLKAGEYAGEHRIFNISAGRGHSLNDIIEMIERIVGKTVKIKYLPGRTFDIPVNILDISRARSHLNWQPNVDIFEGISRAHKWILKDQNNLLGRFSDIQITKTPK